MQDDVRDVLNYCTFSLALLKFFQKSEREWRWREGGREGNERMDGKEGKDEEEKEEEEREMRKRGKEEERERGREGKRKRRGREMRRRRERKERGRGRYIAFSCIMNPHMPHTSPLHFPLLHPCPPPKCTHTPTLHWCP